MSLFDRIRRAFTGEDKVVREQAETKEQQIVFDTYDKGLEATRKNFTQRLTELFTSFDGVDDEFYDQLEEAFISADVGFNMTIALTDAIRDRIESQQLSNLEDVKQAIVSEMVRIYEKDDTQTVLLNENSDGPTVILFVGVNGVGKTTSVGKIGYQLQQQGHKVLMAAGDTFRAGAVEQLNVWGGRLNILSLIHI